MTSPIVISCSVGVLCAAATRFSGEAPDRTRRTTPHHDPNQTVVCPAQYPRVSNSRRGLRVQRARDRVELPPLVKCSTRCLSCGESAGEPSEFAVAAGSCGAVIDAV